MFPIPIRAFCATRECLPPSIRLRTQSRNALCRLRHPARVQAFRSAAAVSGFRGHTAASPRNPRWRIAVLGPGQPYGSRLPRPLEVDWNCPPQQSKRLETRAKRSVRKKVSCLKLQNEFAAVFSPRRIEKSPISRAGKIVLNVPGIEVVEQVEGAHANSGRDMFSVEGQ